jgi:hypothetical protein
MKNFSVAAILIGSLLLAIFFFWQYKSTQSELSLQTQRVTDRDTRIYKQDKLVDSLKKQVSGLPASEEDTIELVTPPSAQFMDELGSLSEGDISRLQKKGLRNPEADLKNDLLKKQQQLIPAKGTAGGTMAIRDIRILNDHFALANFENGPAGGDMILKYQVANGAITWKVVDSKNL